MTMVDNKYHLHQSLGYQLTLTSRMTERRFEEKLKTLGLTRITWCVLLAVEMETLSRPSDIASFIGVDRTATSRALRGMEEDGLIDRAVGAQDKRTTHVYVTGKGKDALNRALPFARQNSIHFGSKLSADENIELRRLLLLLRAGEESELRRF